MALESDLSSSKDSLQFRRRMIGAGEERQEHVSPCISSSRGLLHRLVLPNVVFGALSPRVSAQKDMGQIIIKNIPASFDTSATATAASESLVLHWMTERAREWHYAFFPPVCRNSFVIASPRLLGGRRQRRDHRGRSSCARGTFFSSIAFRVYMCRYKSEELGRFSMLFSNGNASLSQSAGGQLAPAWAVFIEIRRGERRNGWARQLLPDTRTWPEEHHFHNDLFFVGPARYIKPSTNRELLDSSIVSKHFRSRMKLYVSLIRNVSFSCE